MQHAAAYMQAYRERKNTVFQISFASIETPKFTTSHFIKADRVQKSNLGDFFFFFEQAVWRPPLPLLWIDSRMPRPSPLTDSSGRGQRRQRHGGVFVRFCGTGRCGECVIEVPQLIVPLFGAGVHGAEEQPE